MIILTKEKTLELLERSISEFKGFIKTAKLVEFNDIANLETWARNSKILTANIFGLNSKHHEEVSEAVKGVYSKSSASEQKSCGYKILSLLESFAFEVKELWSDNVYEESKESTLDNKEHASNEESIGIDIFLVHGHDHGQLQTVARFLEHVGLNPIILHERANVGATIIEKLERNSDVSYAIILLTPDDIGGIAAGKNLRPRARQNVVLELGYFLGKLGRKRTCALRVEEVEIPSDYSGVLYITIDKEGAWRFQLAKELKAAGLPVDLNRVA